MTSTEMQTSCTSFVELGSLGPALQLRMLGVDLGRACLACFLVRSQ